MMVTQTCGCGLELYSSESLYRHWWKNHPDFHIYIPKKYKRQFRTEEKIQQSKDKKEYINYFDFDGYEAMGRKVMFPIPIKIEIMMDRLFNGYEEEQLYRIMTVQEIKYS